MVAQFSKLASHCCRPFEKIPTLDLTYFFGISLPRHLLIPPPSVRPASPLPPNKEASSRSNTKTQIAQLFIQTIGGDGRPVLESYTGAYAVKIMIDGKWQARVKTVGPMSMFPILRRLMRTPRSERSICCEHFQRSLFVCLFFERW